MISLQDDDDLILIVFICLSMLQTVITFRILALYQLIDYFVETEAAESGSRYDEVSSEESTQGRRLKAGVRLITGRFSMCALRCCIMSA